MKILQPILRKEYVKLPENNINSKDKSILLLHIKYESLEHK